MRIPNPRKMHRTLCVDRYVVPVLALALLFAACGPQETTPGSSSSAGVAETMRTQENTRAPNPLKNLYWGDTHVHTAMSPDAYFFNNTTTSPDIAYRYAKGFPVVNASNGVRIQIGTPLDFLVVSDHAEYLAVPMRIFNDQQASLVKTEFGQRLIDLWEQGERRQAAAELIGTINENRPYAPFLTDAIKQPPWATIIEAAERANEPGTFTAFIGWEWTSFPNASNLHRVVFTPHSATEASTFLPFTALDSSNPEDLWNWLQETSTESGVDFISIPHNGNVSNGLMFSREDFEGNPITAQYAQLRARWEPVYEVTQIKGDSETHPLLSPTDEFADFETYAHLLDAAAVASGGEVAEVVSEGDYARRALRVGLEFEQNLGVNPFKFGLIGSTDSHSTMASAEEDNFWGKFALDSTPAARRDNAILPGTENMWAMSSSGYAGVWAEENTRQSLYEAFMRKEVYATSGPRIQVRLFGGWDFTSADADARNIAEVGYDKGVPMGSDLTQAPDGQAPSFLILAVKDPVEGNLDRVQVVKGWLDANGETHERVYNVAWSGNRSLDGDGKLAPVGNTVDLSTGAYTNTIGTAELATVWQDPAFDSAERAFYYVRVLQIPTPRYSLLDAIALEMDPAETGKPSTIQERAYSSPIWYTPGN